MNRILIKTKKRFLFALILIAGMTLLLGSSILVGCEGQASPVVEEKALGFEDSEVVIQGSDTMLELTQNLAEAFMNKYPGTIISVTGGGSGTGIAALINKTVDIAIASRKIKDSEIEEAKSAGLNPKEYTIAYDGLSVVINKNNPVEELTIEQLSKIFTGRITSWSEVSGSDKTIVVTSRDSSSGTHVYFKEVVVQIFESEKDNEYTANSLFLPSNSAVKEEVSTNENAIGYIGLGYLDDSVKSVKVKLDERSDAVSPSIENVENGSYPIARGLYMYVSRTDLSDLEQALLDFIFSDEGQAIVLDVGFVPVK